MVITITKRYILTVIQKPITVFYDYLSQIIFRDSFSIFFGDSIDVRVST